MAHILFAQEKYPSAEHYAARALAINACSSISCTQMGLVSVEGGKDREGGREKGPVQ